MSTVTVVFGPRTRLGAELVRRALARGESVVAVARHARDEALLGDSGATVVRTEALGELALSADRVRVLVCALGPVQSEDLDVDPADVDRDLAGIEAVLDGAAGTARVVLVSSVLALAPTADRRHYAGWKCLVEHRVREAASRRGADVSVLFPGRLISASEVTKPKHRIYTRYQKLACLVERASDTEPKSRVVGLDARIWLLVRGASVATSAISGSGGMAAGSSAELRVPPIRKQELSG